MALLQPLLCFSILFSFLHYAAAQAYSEDFEQNTIKGELLTNLIDYPATPRPCDVDKITQTDLTLTQIQDQGWKVDNRTLDYDFPGATEAYEFRLVTLTIDNDNVYHFYIDFGAGTVVITTIKRKRTGLYRWSQVLAAMWKYFAPQHGNVKLSSLKSIVQYRIDNTATKDIIKEINSANQRKLDNPNQKINLKPLGVESKALMNTPNGRGQAYLLFEHKDDFKEVVITKVVLMNAVGVLCWEMQYGSRSQVFQG